MELVVSSKKIKNANCFLFGLENFSFLNNVIKINEIDNFVIFGVHMPISIYLMEKNISLIFGHQHLVPSFYRLLF